MEDPAVEEEEEVRELGGVPDQQAERHRMYSEDQGVKDKLEVDLLRQDITRK